MDIYQRIVEDIKNFGWTTISVFAGESEYQFSYTIGIFKSLNAPELFVSGIKGEHAHQIFAEIVKVIQAGGSIALKTETNEFLDGYNCYFDLVDESSYERFFGKAIWFYQGKNFPVIQCIWPNKERLFPWQTGQPFSQDILIEIPKTP